MVARADAELSVFCLLLANILQATIAIRSPPAPYPPLPSPSKSLSPRSKGGQQQQHRATMTPLTWRGKSGGLSPKVRLTPLSNAYTYSWSSIHAPICRQRPSANSPSLPLRPRVATALAVLQTRVVSPSLTSSRLLIIIPLRPTFP
jgi:hypothetical protein